MNTVAAINPQHAAGQRLREQAFRNATLIAAVLVLLLLGGVALSLLVGAWPAFAHFKFAFLTREVWNPVTDEYGALAPVYGTLVTSFLALLLAIPVSLGVAIFLTELAPVWLKRPVGVAIELLAAVPSIIYGIWGLFVLAPILQRYVQPWLIATLGSLPLIGKLFQGPPFGIGVFTASFVLAIMVIPFIAAVMRDVFETVPDVLKESGYGLGATTWEVIWQVVVPYARTGMIGGIMLGLGRALGETMAVTFVIGNAHRISASLLAPGTTISASIANEFTEAVGDLYTSSLVALGALLWHGFSGLSLAVFTQMTPPPGASGGLLNPIVGSLILTVLAVVIGTPIGILAGTYMAEYGRYDRLTSVVRFINDILLSAPSIVVGLFVYEIMVAPMGHFSGWAGGVALSMLVIPVVVRTTEDMLTLVPNSLREAATSIGLPRSLAITRICYRAARAGMLTGVLLAVARISGETAPLLFTSLNNQFWSTNFNGPISSLPVVIFQFALSPYKDWQSLAWTGALIITFTVLALSILARTLASSRKQS